MLLAHAVLPHHHHQMQICFVKSHCADDTNEDGQGTSRDGHTHDGEDNSGTCVLKTLSVTPAFQWKQELKCDNRTNNFSGNIDLQSSLIITGTEPFISVFGKISSDPVLNSSYSFCITCSSGLRAPPVA
jgi:hypothetical protein